MMNGFNTISMTITRDGEDVGTVEGLDLTTELTLPVDADVIKGDVISYVLPNGRTRAMKAKKVDVLQSPFANPVGSNLDHTNIKYDVLD